MSEATFEVDQNRVKTFLKSVRQEVLNIKSGDSQFRTGAMHFEKDQSGAMNRLEMFQENPTKRNLDEFILIATQDFGNRAGEAFEKWSTGMFQELTPAGKPVAPKRSFETEVQAFCYDVLKTGRIPLDPKQMDTLEHVSSKLAKAMKVEISDGIGTQLAVLIKRIEDKKAADKKVEKPKTPVKKKAPAKKAPTVVTEEDLKSNV